MLRTLLWCMPILASVVLYGLVGHEYTVKQLNMMTSVEDFWEPNICVGTRCTTKLAGCLLETNCRQTLVCINTCMLDQPKDKIAACAYICEMTAGYENEEFKDLIGCMLNNKCLKQYPQDGPCRGEDEDAVKEITSLEKVSGDWWVIKGVNCGYGDYPGGYDWYPCQHERFIKTENGQWINNVTYCGGKHNDCWSDMIVTIANVSLTKPGVIHHDYTDAPLDPQSEDWRVVSWPHPDYMLMLWCGRLPVLDYSGGIVLSRHRSDANMPEEVVKEFTEVAKKHGLDYQEFCPSDNTWCPF